MVTKEDWRYINGEHLKDKVFTFKAYKPLHEDNDHDHCEFCWDKFSLNIDDALKEGYQTIFHRNISHNKAIIQDAWVCLECFNDFKGLLKLRIDK